MRRRLIQSTLAVVLVVIAVFGISLVIVESRTIESSAREGVDTEAVRLASIVENRMIAHEAVNERTLAEQVTEGRYAIVDLPGRGPVAVGRRPVGAVISSTQQGARGESVTVQESRARVSQEIGRTLLIILAVALLAVLAAVVLAVRQARRLASPLVDLADTAERLGSGDPRPRHRRYGVAELDRVAEVLDSSAERLARMLTAERRLAADASHQLRTPLTALSMRLEEIISAADHEDTVKEEAAIALGQVERLTDVVQRLLTNNRDPRKGSAVDFDLDEVIKQQVDEWRPAYGGVGRCIISTGQQRLRAIGTPGAVAQVLATLVENGLIHGSGTVTLHTRITGTQAVIEVTDEGQGVPPELGARVFERTVSGRNSTGIGLAVARDLAEADGGRLELLQQRPPVFALFLARDRRDDDERHNDRRDDDRRAESAERPGSGRVTGMPRPGAPSRGAARGPRGHSAGRGTG